MSNTDKSFLISIKQCNSDIARRLSYAIYRAAWFNDLKYAMVGTNVATTNTSFRLYAVVKISGTSNPTNVSTLLRLPISATVVPTNVDFSSSHISANYMRLLEYGSFDDSTIKSESTSALTSDYIIDSDDPSTEHEVEVMVELPNFDLAGGRNEQQQEIEDPIEHPIAGMGDEGDILSVGTYYNEATEMAAFNNMLRGATAEQLESYYRTKRNLDRTTGQVDTLHEDSFCFVCRLKIVANDHRVKLGLHCIQPNCSGAQLYHFPCLLNSIFSTHTLPRCDYCRPTTNR
jgi:hypothetical protein